MIEIKPKIQYPLTCSYCKASLKSEDILWSSGLVCIRGVCVSCGAELISELPTGLVRIRAHQVDIKRGEVFGGDQHFKTLLINSFENSRSTNIHISKETFTKRDKVIILNCIDFMYGHCLLKLLNAQVYLDEYAEYGLIVIVQKFLRWLVPDGVSEIWSVDIPLREGKFYFNSLDKFIHQEIERFQEVQISEAYSHPFKFDITRFTKVPKYDFSRKDIQVTFIWREDRLWFDTLTIQQLVKLNLLSMALQIQNQRIQNLFRYIKAAIPSAKFVVAGLGMKTSFPDWIQDERVEQFDEVIERKICQIYANSLLVIGLHGSNMLLPSGHAGMTLNLMPNYKWGNFAQDILYQEEDPRIAAFRYRYVPATTSIKQIANIAESMITNWTEFNLEFTP